MQEHDGDQNAFGGLVLRPATPQDEPFLRDLFRSTRTEELALVNLDAKQQDFFIDMQFRAQSTQFAMSYPHATNRIIELNGNAVGRFMVDRGAEAILLIDLALLPGHRNAGIGTHLLNQLLAEAAAAGKPVKLSVWHSNPARRLYERIGFSLTSNDGLYFEMLWKPDALA